MNQNKLVLDYLQENGSITPREALDEFGIMRLGARVYELRQQGYPIKTKTTTSRNRYGETVNYATYIYTPGEENHE